MSPGSPDEFLSMLNAVREDPAAYRALLRLRIDRIPLEWWKESFSGDYRIRISAVQLLGSDPRAQAEAHVRLLRDLFLGERIPAVRRAIVWALRERPAFVGSFMGDAEAPVRKEAILALAKAKEGARLLIEHMARETDEELTRAAANLLLEMNAATLIDIWLDMGASKYFPVLRDILSRSSSAALTALLARDARTDGPVAESMLRQLFSSLDLCIEERTWLLAASRMEEGHGFPYFDLLVDLFLKDTSPAIVLPLMERWGKMWKDVDFSVRLAVVKIIYSTAMCAEDADLMERGRHMIEEICRADRRLRHLFDDWRQKRISWRVSKQNPESRRPTLEF